MSIVPLFWIVALLLVAAVLAAIVWPLLRGGADDQGGGEADAATSVYRDQKRQLDDECAAGAISVEERDAAVDELATRLSAEIDQAPTPAIKPGAAATSRARYGWALILVFAVPVASIALYAMFGSPAAMQVAANPPAAQTPASGPQIEAMVEQLAARMKSQPDDPKGWTLLGRSYAVLGRFRESADAYRRAAALAPADAAILAEWADSLAMANGQTLKGEPSRLIDRALAIDPNNPKALALAGSAAAERRDYAAAIADWRKLRPQLQPGSGPEKEVDQMIAEAEAAQAGGAPAPPGATPSASAPTPADIAASTISGRVSLGPALKDRVAPAETLYIFARAVNGPRMPLAVLKEHAGSLPKSFTLDDSMAMSPSARLSTAGKVIVEARISKSGSATPSPGDLRGVSSPVEPGTHGVDIVIDQVVR
ncbi:MAG: c-type cytochrome biogenesis protein CcmI [Betaproteobacteria bacterium]|nr:c-type cytochrome biogenesis protein CcmI [Betaproteobacteria bacterium]